MSHFPVVLLKLFASFIGIKMALLCPRFSEFHTRVWQSHCRLGAGMGIGAENEAVEPFPFWVPHTIMGFLGSGHVGGTAGVPI